MSLINDALKRAKQAHEQKTPPPFRSAPLHTAPTPPHKSNLPLGLIVVAGLFVGFIGLGFFIYTRMHTAREQPIIASTSAVAVAQPATPAPQNPVPAAPVEAPTTMPPQPAEPAKSTEPPTGTRALIIAAPTPIDAPLQIFPAVRLQGLLYSPARPAAIINGRTLFVGDRIGDVRVIAISQSAATVLWNGQTNVLNLSPQ